MAKWKLTERDVKDQLNAAKLATRLVESGEPRAESAHYDPSEGRIVLILSNGADFRFPASSVPELAAASESDIEKVELSPSGRTVRWKALNADLSLAGLMMGIFGPRTWMAQLGSVGGSVTSAAKAAAARANGQKGGRPVRTRDVSKERDQTRRRQPSTIKSDSLRFAAKTRLSPKSTTKSTTKERTSKRKH